MLPPIWKTRQLDSETRGVTYNASFNKRPLTHGQKALFLAASLQPHAFIVAQRIGNYGDRPLKLGVKFRGQTLRNIVFSMGTGPSEVGAANNFRESC